MAWAKLDDRFYDNRKIRRLWRKAPEAVGLHVMAITYCAAHLTDGFVDEDFVEERVPDGRTRNRLVSALVELNLWHTGGHTQEVPGGISGVQPGDKGWFINDYTEFNPTRESVLTQRADRSEAGKKGAKSRWGDGKSHSGTHDHAHGNQDGTPANHVNAPVPARPDPEEAKASSSEIPVPSEAVTISKKLAEQIRERDPKAKVDPLSAGWLKAARLLLERDGRTVEEIAAVLEWLPTDDFWPSVILSMPKFREKFTTLVARMNQAPSNVRHISKRQQVIADRSFYKKYYDDQGRAIS